MDTKLYQKQLDAKNGSGVLQVLEGETFHTRCPVKVRCLRCGTKFTYPYWHLLRLHTTGCRTCSPRGASNVKTHDEYLRQVRAIHGCDVRPVEHYAGAQTKIRHRCSAGHVFDSTPNSTLTGYGCRYCAWSANTAGHRIPISSFLVDLKARNPNVDLVGPYTQITKKTQFYCNACDHQWLTTPNALRRGGCPSCFQSSIASRIYRKHRLIYGGRTHYVQGYEPFAFTLLKTRGVGPDLIQTGAAVPRIRYWLTTDKKLHWYTPDIWIPSRNGLIEVKSTHTLGLFRTDRHRLTFLKVRAKARAALTEGYDFRLWLFNPKGDRITLPEDWHLLSHSQLLRKMKQ